MSSVIVTGLPGDVKVSKLIFVFKNVLKNQKFWIRELSHIPGTENKQMTIEFESSHQANKAQKFLDQFIFRSGHLMFPLRARLEVDFSSSRKRYRSPNLYDYRERSPHGYQDSSSLGYRDRNSHGYRDRSSEWDRRNKQYTRERSHSPLYNESSKLDLEIELLRKQRMVIEEERRLLLERKKLELIRDCGPNASNELDFLQDDRDNRFSRDRRMPDNNKRARYRSPPRPKAYKKPQERQSLPWFVLPCKKILNEMRHLIEQYEDTATLVKLIRSTLRRRIAIALENKPHMNTNEIVVLYRKYYPTTTDETLITQIMKNINESYLPRRNDDGNPKQQKKQADGKRYASKQDAGTSNSDDIRADKTGNSKKNAHQAAIDNMEMLNEWDLSLDASDIQLSLKNVDIDWADGEDWSEVVEDDEKLSKSD